MLDSLENQIFSIIKYRFSDRIKNKYPDLNFTTSNRSPTTPKFPTVYIHFMGSPETGNDLEGSRINVVSATFQVDVSDNQSQSRAKEVADEVLRIMKTLSFSVSVMPNFDNTGNVYRSIARYSRDIGWNDYL